MRATLLALALVLACAAPHVALRPGAAQVRVGKIDPPAGARELGPLLAADRSYANALAMLKNEAAERNANYVKLTSLTEPHAESDGCYEERFIVRAMAYQLERPSMAH